MKKLTLEEFDLQKVKLNSKKGLNISFWQKGNNNELFTVESDTLPHPDITNKLDELKELFAVSMDSLDGWELARENCRKNDEALKEAIRGYKEEIDRYNVNGVVLVGKEQYLGIKITGSRSTESGKVGLTSPTIRFTDENEDINAKATDLFDDIQQEVWMYLFKNKKAQPDLMDLISQEEQDESGLNNMRVAL